MEQRRVVYFCDGCGQSAPPSMESYYDIFGFKCRYKSYIPFDWVRFANMDLCPTCKAKIDAVMPNKDDIEIATAKVRGVLNAQDR